MKISLNGNYVGASWFLAVFVVLIVSLSASAGTVALWYPLNGTDTRSVSGSDTMRFIWTTDSSAVHTDTSFGDSFLLRICKDSPCLNAVDTKWVYSNTTPAQVVAGSVALRYEDTFYWIVNAYDSDVGGNTASTDWTGTGGPWQIRYDTHADTIKIKAPSNGHQTTVLQNIVLEWNALTDSTGIDSYVLHVSTGDTFKHLAFVDTIDGTITADTVTATLTGWDTYFWHVAAIDSLGNRSESWAPGKLAIVGDSTSLSPVVGNTVSVTLTLPDGKTHGTDFKNVQVKSDTGISTLTAYNPSCSIVINDVNGETIRIYIKTNGPSGTAGIIVRFPADTEFDETTASGASDSSGTGFSLGGWKYFDTAALLAEGTMLGLSFQDTKGTLGDLTTGSFNQTYSYMLEWSISSNGFNNFILPAGGDTNSLSIYSSSAINGTYSSIGNLSFISDTGGVYVFRSGELTSASFKFIGTGGGSAKIEFPGTCVVERHISSPRALAGLRALRDSTLATSWGRRLAGWFYRF